MEMRPLFNLEMNVVAARREPSGETIEAAAGTLPTPSKEGEQNLHFPFD